VGPDSLHVYIPDGITSSNTPALDTLCFAAVNFEPRCLGHFENFRLPLASLAEPACFEFVRDGTTPALPFECDGLPSGRVFSESVASGNVFWYDSTGRRVRTLDVRLSGVLRKTCAGNEGSCNVSVGSNDVLVDMVMTTVPPPVTETIPPTATPNIIPTLPPTIDVISTEVETVPPRVETLVALEPDTPTPTASITPVPTESLDYLFLVTIGWDFQIRFRNTETVGIVLLGRGSQNETTVTINADGTTTARKVAVTFDNDWYQIGHVVETYPANASVPQTIGGIVLAEGEMLEIGQHFSQYTTPYRVYTINFVDAGYQIVILQPNRSPVEMSFPSFSETDTTIRVYSNCEFLLSHSLMTDNADFNPGEPADPLEVMGIEPSTIDNSEFFGLVVEHRYHPRTYIRFVDANNPLACLN
jgi:hypothetical protein